METIMLPINESSLLVNNIRITLFQHDIDTHTHLKSQINTILIYEKFHTIPNGKTCLYMNILQ